MKKLLAFFIAAMLIFSCSCQKEENYNLSEKTFFMVMTNIQYYPEKYVGKDIELDCFTYTLTDVDGKTYTCGVRKCSSGYGCRCGKDTVIGFILDYGGAIPEPKNQSEDTNDKSWVHLKGKIESDSFTEIKIYPYIGEEIDYSSTETVKFLTFKVENLEIIEDYSSLNYYVTK